MSVLGEARATLRPPGGAPHGPLPPLMILLTFVTGVVDAASYLKLGHVFVANMTGNIVFLGFALAGAGGLSISASLTALGSFLLGAAVGGWMASRSAGHRARLLRGVGAAQGTLMAVALIAALPAAEPLHTGVRYALLALLALAMGLQNAAAQRLAVPELTTSVLTRTLTGIASELGVLGGPGAQFGRRSLAVAAMLLGALTGGLLVLHVSVAGALAVACVLVLVVSLAVHLLARSQQPWVRA